MAYSKYADDYRLENVMDAKGRLVTKPVYRGDLFDFKVQGEELRKVKVTVAVSTAVEVVLLVSSLFLNTGSMRSLFVVLPFLGVAFPLLGQVDAVLSLLRTKVPMERSAKDRVSQKLVAYVFACAFLSFCSVCGHAVHWLTRGESVGDMVFLAMTLLVFSLSLNLFLSRGKLEMEKVGSTKLEAEEK